MLQLKRIGIAVSITICFLLQADGADKYTDENRPYEFGFTVDGQQHRHEKKDKDGIIMGEFGFITADDVYHVTVYATDKEGRFKILSMKNIHLKSSQAAPGPATSSRQGHALALPPAQTPAPAAPQTTQPPQPKPISLEPPARSCSSCSLPPTTTKAPPPPLLPPQQSPIPSNNQYEKPNQFSNPNQFGRPNPVGTSVPQRPSSIPVAQTYGNNYPTNPQTYGQQDTSSYPQPPVSTQQNYPGSPNLPNAANTPYAGGEQGAFGQPIGESPAGPNGPQNYPVSNTPYVGGEQGAFGQPIGGSPAGPNGPQNYPESAYNPSPVSPGSPNYSPQNRQEYPNVPSSELPSNERNPKQYNGPEPQYNPNSGFSGPEGARPQGQQPGSVKPTLVSAQMQIVDKNTDIHSLRPGEKQGLPPGLSEGDMTDLLYTFNYTVGFHGHFEEGYRNGAKKGYYYVTGRNGVRTRIDYTADESGFHPKVSQEVLDLISEDVPKPETERDAKYGLKGYEFKWLYYPTDPKRR